MSDNKKSKFSRYGNSSQKGIGSDVLGSQVPFCKPALGRKPKALSGPVHPGFSKPNPAPTTKKSPTARPIIQVAEQNNDLYRPLKKTKKAPKK